MRSIVTQTVNLEPKKNKKNKQLNKKVKEFKKPVCNRKFLDSDSFYYLLRPVCFKPNTSCPRAAVARIDVEWSRALWRHSRLGRWRQAPGVHCCVFWHVACQACAVRFRQIHACYLQYHRWRNRRGSRPTPAILHNRQKKRVTFCCIALRARRSWVRGRSAV